MDEARIRSISEHDIDVIYSLHEIAEKGNSAEVKMKNGELTVMDVSKKTVQFRRK